jgi:hypothetical protein
MKRFKKIFSLIFELHLQHFRKLKVVALRYTVWPLRSGTYVLVIIKLQIFNQF